VFVFKCSGCNGVFKENEAELNSGGRFTCPNCKIALETFDLTKIPSYGLTITIKDGDGAIIDEVEYFATPWNPITEAIFDDLKQYCSKSLKLLTPKDI